MGGGGHSFIHLAGLFGLFARGPSFLLLVIIEIIQVFCSKCREMANRMGKMAKAAAVLLSFTLLVNLPQSLHALRGALARVGRSSAKFDDDTFLGLPLGESSIYRTLFESKPRKFDRLLLASAVGQPKLHRFGRSLYGVDGPSASAIMRSQRGLLQSPEEQRSVIVIDADDGQLMRYGKR